MPEILLFLIGLAVTAAVVTAFGLLIYAEVQDGKTADAVDAGENHSLDDTVAERRPVVT